MINSSVLTTFFLLLLLLPLALSSIEKSNNTENEGVVAVITEKATTTTTYYDFNSTDDDDSYPFNLTIPSNKTRGNSTNDEHNGFLHGFVEAFSVIFVSELGDKTFFIAAILAMRSNKLIVFLGALSALALMTVLSALLGWVVTSFIPRIYTYYACTIIMFLFGIKMLYEAYKMKPNEGEEIQQEVEEELQRNGSLNSMHQSTDNENHQADDPERQEPMNERSETSTPTPNPTESKKSSKKQPKEKSLFGKRCYKIFKIFTRCFALTFLAEWGDRSQLATIVLASINDVAGVTVGGVAGHTICTGIAVVAGALVAKRVSVRTMTFIGAIVFMAFAIASLFFDPNTEETIDIDI